MKKHLLIAGLICVATIPSAVAVTKCVKLSSSSTCSNYAGDGSNWSITCDGVPVSGVIFCGSQDGGSRGATSTAVAISSTIEDNKYCWCKMTSPAVSQWVFANELTSASQCKTLCVLNCAYGTQSQASMRSAMFSNLSD